MKLFRTASNRKLGGAWEQGYISPFLASVPDKKSAPAQINPSVVERYKFQMKSRDETTPFLAMYVDSYMGSNVYT